MNKSLIINVSILILLCAGCGKVRHDDRALGKLIDDERFIMLKEAVDRGQIDIAYNPLTEQYHLKNLSGPRLSYCPFTGFLLDKDAQVRYQDLEFDEKLSSEIQVVTNKLIKCNNLLDVVEIFGQPHATSKQGSAIVYGYYNLIYDKSVFFEISDDDKPGVIIHVNRGR